MKENEYTSWFNRQNEIRKIRNQIQKLIKSINCHIEIGNDCITGPVFYLCPDEQHPSWVDDPIQMAKKEYITIKQ